MTRLQNQKNFKQFKKFCSGNSEIEFKMFLEIFSKKNLTKRSSTTNTYIINKFLQN